jgi:hypothetical protein
MEPEDPFVFRVESWNFLAGVYILRPLALLVGRMGDGAGGLRIGFGRRRQRIGFGGLILQEGGFFGRRSVRGCEVLGLGFVGEGRGLRSRLWGGDEEKKGEQETRQIGDEDFRGLPWVSKFKEA